MGQEVDTHSGVAINLLQKAGIAELGTFLRNYRAWKIRVYKAIWNIVKRTWQAERWIRISDNQNFAQFLQVNGMEMDEWGQPIMINFIGNLNVEITMDEGPDVENLMQDTYNSIKDDPTIPWQIKLEFMPLPSTFKKNIEQKLAAASQQQKPDPKMQAAMVQAQTAQQKGQIDIQKAQIDAQAAQQKSQAETAVAHMAAQAEITNAQQDALARQQDAQLQREKAQAEREQIRMEMAQAAADHAYKMRELAAQHETRQAEHEARRQAIRSKPRQPQAGA
jgi:hypothetical protein